MKRLALIVLAVTWATAAEAHEWFSNQHNENNEACCSGSDCRLLPDGAAAAVKNGYVIKWLPPDFPNAGQITLPVFVPNERAKPGEDPNHFAACVWGGQVRCFFTPSPGY